MSELNELQTLIMMIPKEMWKDHNDEINRCIDVIKEQRTYLDKIILDYSLLKNEVDDLRKENKKLIEDRDHYKPMFEDYRDIINIQDDTIKANLGVWNPEGKNYKLLEENEVYKDHIKRLKAIIYDLEKENAILKDGIKEIFKRDSNWIEINDYRIVIDASWDDEESISKIKAMLELVEDKK